MNDILFTDWSQTSPVYFYIRGAIWGFVCASLFWKVFIPYIKEKIIIYKIKNR